jgi:hypothetical protein
MDLDPVESCGQGVGGSDAELLDDSGISSDVRARGVSNGIIPSTVYT